MQQDLGLQDQLQTLHAQEKGLVELKLGDQGVPQDTHHLNHMAQSIGEIKSGGFSAGKED